MFEKEPKIVVEDRIFQRHAIENEDVEEAMRNMVRFQQRETGEYIAVGFDRNGRQLELVYDHDDETDTFTVFHAMRATKKFLSEMRMA